MKKIMVIFLLLCLLILFSCKDQTHKPVIRTPVIVKESEIPAIVFKKALPPEQAPVKVIKEEKPEACVIRVEYFEQDNEVDVYFNEKRISILPGYLVCDETTNRLYKVRIREKKKSLPCTANLPGSKLDLIKFLADNKILYDESETCIYGCMKGINPGRCNPTPAKTSIGKSREEVREVGGVRIRV